MVFRPFIIHKITIFSPIEHHQITIPLENPHRAPRKGGLQEVRRALPTGLGRAEPAGLEEWEASGKPMEKWGNS